MKSILLLTSFISLTFFVSLVSFSSPEPASLAADVLNYTNMFRKSRGLGALVMTEDLNVIAQKHSEDMAKGRVSFGHGGFNQRFSEASKKIKGFKAFAENVAYGARSGKEVVTIWKNSPGHRQNMLGHYRFIGIGIARDRRGEIFYTQVFVN